MEGDTVKARVLSLAALTFACSLAAPASALDPITRDKIIELASYSDGYSYWWGHGRFRTDGSDAGSCSGSCPSCTHGGSHGGDCSGLVGKAWQVPAPSDLDHDDHPYSTVNFRNDTTHWDPIDRGAAIRGDAFVHNENGAGHTYIYEKGDPWGDHWSYECKGCSWGCVHDLRTANDTYIAIRRQALDEGPHVDAGFVAQWSDAEADPEGKASFRVCAGAPVRFWFELKNTGADAWVDLGDKAAGSGQAVRLATPGDLVDPFTGTTRISLNENANADVHADGADCNDAAGCSRTVFTKAGIAGNAPAKAGVYETAWQLVDEGRGSFGPTMSMAFSVIDCAEGAGGAGLGGEGGASGSTGGGSTGGGGARATGQGGAPSADGSSADTMNGSTCSVGSAGSARGSWGLAALAVAALAGALRRRGQPAWPTGRTGRSIGV